MNLSKLITSMLAMSLIFVGCFTMGGILEPTVSVNETFGYLIMVVGAFLAFEIINEDKFEILKEKLKKEEAAREADTNTMNYRLNSHVELLTNRIDYLEDKVSKKDP